MADDIETIGSEELPKPIPPQMNLGDLVDLAKPLVDSYMNAKTEQNQLGFDHEIKVLEIQSKQNILLIKGLFIILFIVFLISGFLYYQGRDNTATNLIQIVIALGAAAFGGYGWSQSKYLQNKKDE